MTLRNTKYSINVKVYFIESKLNININKSIKQRSNNRDFFPDEFPRCVTAVSCYSINNK